MKCIYGVLDETLAPNGSADATVWRGNAATTTKVKVYDLCLRPNETINSGTRMVAMLDADTSRYYVTGWRCHIV